MKKATLLLITALICASVVAQIAKKELQPRGFDYDNKLSKNREMILLPSLDLQKYIKEDANQPKGVAQRFAAPIEISININKDGNWTNLLNGDKIWQVELKSEGAYNLNFQFNQFHLPIGGEFYIYSSDKNDVRGAFTSDNNRLDNSFAVYLVKGESAILEYYQPKNTIGLPEIEVKRVLHGYKSTQNFGDAGSCNNNVNCPEGADWVNEKKAVALIVSGGVNGTRWCSGAMVSNVREDGSPFFLTANHCLAGNESNWAFIYNYESPNCTNIDGSFSESVLGAQVLANGSASDFALLLLDNSPPTNYDVYHSGWDANDVLKDSVVGVHHPRGDIKKISFDFDSIESSGYYGAGNDHWEVLDWNDGTTEPTSSGSPLYDKFHRIIGQLHGGDAACGNDDQDYYGKFSHSWDVGTLPSTQIMHWLDPDSTGTTVLDGTNFNIPMNALDAAVTFLAVSDECDTLMTGAEVKFKNLGSDTINSLELRAFLDNDSLQWATINLTLPFGNSDLFTLADFDVEPGNHNLKIILTNPNGSTDDNSLNDTMIRSFKAINGNSIIVNVNTDYYGYETGVEITDDNGTVIYSKLGFPGYSSIDIGNCLEDGCYTVKITDDYDDGISGESIYLYNGSIPFDTLSGNFTTETSTDFCVCSGVIVDSLTSELCSPNSIEIHSSKDFKLYPNPTTGVINISPTFIIEVITVFDAIGNEIFVKNNFTSNKNEIDLSNQPKGMYFLHILSKGNSVMKKVIIR